jgi:hypothetical protein
MAEIGAAFTKVEQIHYGVGKALSEDTEPLGGNASTITPSQLWNAFVPQLVRPRLLSCPAFLPSFPAHPASPSASASWVERDVG